MYYLRFIYELDSNNNIYNLTTEYVNEYYNYFMFIKDNKIIVNSGRTKITKGSLLRDIEVWNKYKEKGMNLFKDINAFNINFINTLRDYNINTNDLKEAIDSGKNYHKRNNFNYQPNKSVGAINQGYVVGS